jgi:hypothetical protein
MNLSHLTPLERTIVRVIAALPDSFAQRKAILGDLLALIPDGHRFKLTVGEMVNWLEAHDQHQLTFLNELNPPASPDANGPTGK